MQLTLKNQISIGNCDFYGFANAQKNIRKALEQKGVEINCFAEKTLSHIGAHLFEPDSDKTDYLWYPHEADKINPGVVKNMNKADYVIASCEHNKKVFRENGITKPLSVCKLGIDTDIFKVDKNIKKSEKFRFLWIGNPVDMRKGWDLAADAFEKEFTPKEPVEFYFKTTGKALQDLAQIRENVIFDSRNLPLADMLDLYQSAHAFIYPSRGEGTGLPALEAMAMELPVLAPPIQGMADFIQKDTSMPLEYEYIDGHYGVDVKVPQVKLDDLKSKMRYVFNDFKCNNAIAAKQIGERARNFVVENHSLESMGERLVEIIFN